MKKLTITPLIIVLCVCLSLPVLAAGEDSAGASPNGEPITVYATVAVAGEFAEDADGKLVAGSAVFGKPDRAAAIAGIRMAADVKP